MELAGLALDHYGSLAVLCATARGRDKHETKRNDSAIRTLPDTKTSPFAHMYLEMHRKTRSALGQGKIASRRVAGKEFRHCTLLRREREQEQEVCGNKLLTGIVQWEKCHFPPGMSYGERRNG